MSEKIIGYLLLAIGIIVIVASGFNIYAVFTRKMSPVSLFSLSSSSLDFSQLISGYLPPGSPAAPPLSLPTDSLNFTFNLSAHLFLVGFIAHLGYQLASLGVQLVRPIEVKLREAKTS